MNIREHCLNALVTIDKNNSYSNLVVKEYLQKYSFTTEDKALFTNMVYGVIAHKKYLFFVLQKYVKRPHKQVFWIKNLLLMSAYQILFLDIPDFAVTSESVKIAKKKGGPSKGNFINGVLRSIIRNKDSIEIPKDDLVEYLSIKYSLQEWMIEEFQKALSDKNELESFCASFNESLPLTIRVNTLKISKEEIMDKLNSLNIPNNQSNICNDGLVLSRKVPISKLQMLLDEGICIIQDQSSIKVGEILDPRPGEKILDMCAAPGGKSTHLAQLMENRGSLMSCDIHQHKMQLVNDLASKLGINIIETKLLDGTTAKDNLQHESFDKILLDAPCSGLGVMVGKPDIKWSKTKEDLKGIEEIQRNLLHNASLLLKKGGTLVYSTCTITKGENEEMIGYFLEKHKNFQLDEETKLFPHKHKCHGFYIAKLTKRDN